MLLLAGVACYWMGCRPVREGVSAEVTLPRLMEIDDWAPYIGKSVQLRGAVCDFEMQHLLYSTPDGALRYVCVDVPRPGGGSYQLLAYTRFPEGVRRQLAMDALLTGQLIEVSGAGKGGSTHREYAVLVAD